MTTPAPDLADRYGGRDGARRPLVVAGVVVLALVAGAWLVWAAVVHARPQVSSQLVGYDVRDSQTAEVSFTVNRRDEDVSASCLVRAFSADHAVVGEVTVPVEPGPRLARVDSTLRTERLATSVELVGCTAPGQQRRR